MKRDYRHFFASTIVTLFCLFHLAIFISFLLGMSYVDDIYRSYRKWILISISIVLVILCWIAGVLQLLDHRDLDNKIAGLCTILFFFLYFPSVISFYLFYISGLSRKQYKKELKLWFVFHLDDLKKFIKVDKLPPNIQRELLLTQKLLELGSFTKLEAAETQLETILKVIPLEKLPLIYCPNIVLYRKLGILES